MRTVWIVRIVMLASCCLWLAACSTQSPQKSAGTMSGDEHAVRFALYDQFGEWRGVPYRMGGLSKSGVDCSGLVYLTFRDRFNVQLPRSTRDLARMGSSVKPGDRQSGDLVLFRINRNLNHVGIYLEDGRFMHTSSRKGVMISSLSDPYWQKRYWKTVRPRQSLLAQR